MRSTVCTARSTPAQYPRGAASSTFSTVLDGLAFTAIVEGAPGTLSPMAQRHLDRLTPVDASFLHQEGPTSHMHVGGLTIVEGPPPSMEEFLEQIRRRLHLVPRYRHKLAHTALDSGRPVWIDDPSFNLEYHVRHTALPTPGGWEQLQGLTARIFSQQLDRSKPLWEMWLIEGLAGRSLRADLKDPPLADRRDRRDRPGDGAVRPLPGPAAAARTPGARGSRTREPGVAELLAAGLRGAVRAGIELAEGALDALSHPEHALARAREAAEGIGEIVWAGLNPAPETPLNVDIGPHRRFVGVGSSLEDFKLVKNAFGGTVNDVVLAVVAGRAALVPDLPRGAHRGHGDARARARVGARRGRAPRRAATASS